MRTLNATVTIDAPDGQEPDPLMVGSALAKACPECGHVTLMWVAPSPAIALPPGVTCLGMWIEVLTHTPDCPRPKG